MNLTELLKASKISVWKLGWKALWSKEAAADYLLGKANTLVVNLLESPALTIYYGAIAQRLDQIRIALVNLDWAVPVSWRKYYNGALTALHAVETALEDCRVTADDVRQVGQAFQLAYATWMSEG